MEAYGGSEFIIPFILISALDEGKWLEPRTGRFVFKERFLSTTGIGDCEGLRACLVSLEKRKIS